MVSGLRVNVAFLGAASSFACDVPWSLASFGVFSTFGSWFGPSLSCRACRCGALAFVLFFFFGALSCTLLPPSPFFFFLAGFSLYASLLAVVSLSDSTASLFRLLKFAPRPSLSFLVFFVSLVTRSFNARWALSNIIFGDTLDAFWLPPCGAGGGRGVAGFSCFSIFIGLSSVGGAQSLSSTMGLPNSLSFSNFSSSFIAKSNGTSIGEGR